MSATAPPTNIQAWLRDHSELLAISFRSAGRIRHNVTKGESREHQILDTLSKLLPTRSSVESNIVIVDATDSQSPKFDGGLVDRALWPRIFADGNTTGVMIESVLAAIEVKSTLNRSELDDIFKKSTQLRSMRSGRSRPLVTAFAYECPNPNLSFFDFATLFSRTPATSPSLVCILNRHLFALARYEGTRFVPEDEPALSSIPVLYTPSEDTLLVYLHFLSQWVTAGTSAADAFMRYSQSVFSRMTVFHFSSDFLNAIKASKSNLLVARKHFEGKANEDIATLYASARTAIGLSPTSTS